MWDEPLITQLLQGGGCIEPLVAFSHRLTELPMMPNIDNQKDVCECS
jgi:hypothetical protein